MQYSSSSENYVSSMKNSPSRWSGDEKSKAYGYSKKASYNYSTSGNTSTTSQTGGQQQPGNNIDQLDVLLEDLKNERRISKEKDYGHPSSSHIIREHENLSTAIPLISEISKTTKTTKHLEPTNTSYSSNKYYNEYQKKETIKEELPIIVKNTTKSTTTLDKEIDDIALPASILPPPGTKVTTTVRTYTYEIPPGGEHQSTTDFSSTINRNTIKRTDEAADMAEYDFSRHKMHSPPTVAGTTKYHSESYSSSSKTEKLPVIPAATSYHSENYSSSSTTDKLLPVVPANTMYSSESYSSNTKTTPIPVATNQVYELREVREVSTSRAPQPRNQAIHNTVVYNVSSRQRSPSEPRTNGVLPSALPPTDNIYGRTINTTSTSNIDRSYRHADIPPQAPVNPHETNLASYHYSSTTTTKSGGQSGPDFGGPPQSRPAPFPVDNADYRTPDKQTPTKVDDLMQSFETTELSSEVDSPHRKHEVDTSTASPKQQHVPSVNRPGKEVFYPPGHDMMLTKRQEMSASQGGGRWAKGSGMYEYEAGAKSSSKSKSGATMVPVCLPLCCAMPCSIM